MSEIQGTGEEKDKGRIICVRLGDLAVVEEYAPVESKGKETREQVLPSTSWAYSKG